MKQQVIKCQQTSKDADPLVQLNSREAQEKRPNKTCEQTRVYPPISTLRCLYSAFDLLTSVP
jgi:hypothetical protein